MNTTKLPKQAVVAGDALTDTVGVSEEDTCMVIAFDVAGLLPIQGISEVITHVTTALFVNELLLKVAEFVPTFEPFTFHWKLGAAPPLTVVAVKVTEVPVQIVPVSDDWMLTDAVKEAGVTFT